MHNDIKPGNILVMEKVFYPRVVVSDFGLCMSTTDLEAYAEHKVRLAVS